MAMFRRKLENASEIQRANLGDSTRYYWISLLLAYLSTDQRNTRIRVCGRNFQIMGLDWWNLPTCRVNQFLGLPIPALSFSL